ncbi:hypothetical protein B0T25DRAFT_546165 [Lasiosphaeria hispida]|uniref:Uncharacterized protein n=1 Tax=Lasiosphaeria hispida TaxID=260671 RepID=A0AAJ0HD81_9PEZI|nr:hypothetical protein B0T25DRAFT_546165 [Lasiosphaeria hispida]
MRSALLTLLLLATSRRSLAQDSCAFRNLGVSCIPGKPNGAFCSSPSLTSNIIIRCEDDCPVPGNCRTNINFSPNAGVDITPKCYEDSPTAGNAQCTYDCVSVTALNGTIFYPMGCSWVIQNGTGNPSSTSLTGLPTPTQDPTATGPMSTPTNGGGSAMRLSTFGLVLFISLFCALLWM